MNEIPFPETLARFNADPRSLLWEIPGIWPVDKPSGPSSNLIVVRSRKALATKRTGHAGTLDPLASGLLLVLAGNATRLFDHLQEAHKTYVADFVLGSRTDSQDITGNPDESFSPSVSLPVPGEAMEAALARFTGDILQTPPMHSALKKDGQPLYKLARQGVNIDRAPRPMTVYSLRLLRFDGAAGTLEMEVSKGFYVRTLIDDLGLALGAGAVMTALRRTRIGIFSLEDAIPPEEMEQQRKKRECEGDGTESAR